MFRRTLPWMAVAILFLGATPALRAELCPSCRSRSHTKDLGSCKLCEGMTGSGEFALCMDCSDRLQECEQCRKALAPKAPKPDEKKSGTHTYGRWVYEFSVSNEGTKSEGYFGKLSYSGRALPEPADLNDHLRSPWGLMYWVGQPSVPFGGHGWMLRPLPSKPLGRLLQPTDSVVVKLKVMAADRGEAPEEDWIRQQMKAMQIPKGVGSGSQWITLGKDPVTIQNSTYFGQVFLALRDPGGKAPLRLEITGARPLTLEIPREPGTRRILSYTTAKVPESPDYYFALSVEGPSAR